MKCSIITIHHIHNFGSVFQAYALAKFLETNGYETEIIDYQPPYYNFGRNKAKTLIGRFLNPIAYCKRNSKFKKFITENEPLSEKRFTSVSELEKHYLNSKNIFIVGGDQLWNDYHPCGTDFAYKLCFTNSSKKIAYGTSMGRNNFSSKELSNISSLINDFSSIMLREKSTVAMLQQHTAVPVNHVIDPVGLLSREDFEKIAIKPKLKVPYAVMYLADSSPLLDEAVSFLSKKMGLKIVHICGFKKKCYTDYFLKDSGPKEILGYMLHADFILSASFHATLFSLLFSKQFATLLPGKQTNARIQDLLTFVGLNKRIIHTNENIHTISEKISYDKASCKLKELSEYSKKLLINTLSNLEK